MDVTKAGTSYLSVPEFYAGKTVFITGGTGFLGKVSNNSFKISHIDTCYMHCHLF